MFGLYKRKTQPANVSLERIPWNEVVDECYDKQLSFVYDITKVIYTDDRTERAVVLQKPDGLYTVVLEKLYPFDDYELRYAESHGYWSPYNRIISIFDTEECAVNSIIADPPFKYNKRQL